MIIRASFWLSYQDSNLDKQNQKLLCYHYTIGQTYALSVKKRCKIEVCKQTSKYFDYFFTLPPCKSLNFTSRSAEIVLFTTLNKQIFPVKQIGSRNNLVKSFQFFFIQ